MSISLGADQRRPEPKRDRYGRYVIDGRSWQRVTTLAKVLDDTSSLADWKSRMTAVGLAKRPDLFAQVATCSVDDRKALNDLCEQAKEAAGASVKANLGTAVHAMCEQVDLGLSKLEDVPEQWRADVAAYRAATEALRPWSHVEAILVNRTLDVAGTTDRLGVRVADIKTGSLDYAAVAIAIQMAAYAYADEVYDLTTDTLTPMPAVDRSVGLVIHLPIGEGVCTLHEVDLVEGWRLAQLAVEVREARAKGRKEHALLRPTGDPVHISVPLAEVIEQLADPFAGLPTAKDRPFEPKPNRTVKHSWQRPVAAGAKPGDEINNGEGPYATAEQIAACKQRLALLKDVAPGAFGVLEAIYGRAATASPSTFGLSTKVPSRRRWMIQRALLALAEHYGDDADEGQPLDLHTALRCLGLVVADAQQPAVEIHTALLALTPAEAEQFHRVALAVCTGDAELVFNDDDGTAIWRADPKTLANPAA